MKTMTLILGLFLSVALSLSAQKSNVNLDKSIVKWTGNKIGGSHHGEIKIKSGEFEFINGTFSSGKVVIDMTTITNADLEDADYNRKLVGHLMSDDFFGVDKYPTATFVVSSADNFKDDQARVTGILTIKGKSESISFMVTKKGDAYYARMKVDRSKFDVRYGSNSFFDNLGDTAIDDIFIIDIKLVFNTK